MADHLDELMKERRRLIERGKLSAETLATNELELSPSRRPSGRCRPRPFGPSTSGTISIYYLHLYRGAEAPIRANREVALLSRMFSRLVNQGGLDANPCTGVERNEESERDRLVTDAEFDAFVEFCRENGHLGPDSPVKATSDAGTRIALAATVAYLTGKAQGQVLRISRTQIKEDGVEFAGRKSCVRQVVQFG